jgi:integrase
MATIYKPGKQGGESRMYKMDFVDHQGKRRRVSLGTNDRRVADTIGRKIEEDVDRLRMGMEPKYPDLAGAYLGLVAPGASARTWKAFRQRFEAEYLAGLRMTTRDKHKAVLDVFEEEVRPQALSEITAETVSRFRAALLARPVKKSGKPTGQVGLAPWTVKNYLIALKTALGWAKDQRLICAVPDFPAVKVPKKKPQPITEGDWQKLLSKAPDAPWRAYLLCGWLAGLRLSEAYRLRRRPSEEWPWLDLGADRIVLPARFAKSDEDQWVPLHPDLRAALAALPETGDEVFPFRSRKGGKPLSRAGLTNRVILMARQAGVKLSMHRLRKGFGCRVAQQLGRGNAPVLHRLMRHSSMQITMDFYASVDDVLHDAIRQLDRSSPKTTPEITPTPTQGAQGVPA